MSTEQRPGASGSHAGLDPEGDVVLIFYAGCFIFWGTGVQAGFSETLSPCVASLKPDCTPVC